jgi:predicted dehydrogenase
MTEAKTRWGILGAAEIARKNWHAILNSGLGVITAVASRDLAKAQRFIADGQRQFPFAQAPAAVGSYEALLERPDIDAVYIPLPTGLRQEWVLRAARAGKHVLCEKPCAINVRALREMIEACRAARVQFLDGVMFVHSRRLEALRTVLDDGQTIGEPRRLESAFSFRAAPDFFAGNIRAHSGLEPDGCLGDLGWYCIRLALWLNHGRLPLSVSGRCLSQLGRPDSPAQVPTEFSGELIFADNFSSGFYCSFVTELQQWAQLGGTKGSLRIDDFVLPHYGAEVSFTTCQPSFQVHGGQFNMEPRERRVVVPEYSNNHESAQETNLFRNFARQIQSGTLNEEWPDIALKTQQIVEALLTSARQQSQSQPL